MMRNTLLALAALAFPLVFAQEAPTATKEFDLEGSKQWLDTGIDLKPGDMIRLFGSGTIRYSTSQKDNGPEGGARAWMDLLRTYPLNDVPKGALIGRIGDRDTARPFLIGAQREQRIGLAGRLFIGINQMSGDSAKGTFKVKVEQYAAKAPASGTTAATTTASVKVKLTQAQLDSVPKRVVDAANNQGDRVNFVIVGSENPARC